ncbi:response regulator transcription factor [Jejubacter calystegiae]|uniref:Response regulator transcription factor n=1 Tax=Jejubacter calystegiae TaxID=2579935 RepID=A0A4V1G7N8_9ENTR|nr:response regulator transcription factor [Jejubacter calystegiae]QCT20297.1 response regulator transcription factor [Jejubacter calystegiae]
MEALLIDDDIELSELLQQQMATYSINLTLCHLPSTLLVLINQRRFDVILLDIMLPEMSGFELCHLLRSREHLNRHTPFIMLTARNETVNLIAGLEAGADDYVSKPFETRELVARMFAVCRRNRPQLTALIPDIETVTSGPHKITLSMSQAWVTVNDQPLKVTSTEMAILAQLMQRPGKIYLRAELELQILTHARQTQRSIDTLIYRLRSKIRAVTGDEIFIYTIRSHGYMLRGAPSLSGSTQGTDLHD